MKKQGVFKMTPPLTPRPPTPLERLPPQALAGESSRLFAISNNRILLDDHSFTTPPGDNFIFYTRRTRPTQTKAVAEEVFSNQKKCFLQIKQNFKNSFKKLSTVSFSVHNEVFIYISSTINNSIKKTEKAFQDWQKILFSEELPWNTIQLALLTRKETAEENLRDLKNLEIEMKIMKTRPDHNLWISFQTAQFFSKKI